MSWIKTNYDFPARFAVLTVSTRQVHVWNNIHGSLREVGLESPEAIEQVVCGIIAKYRADLAGGILLAIRHDSMTMNMELTYAHPSFPGVEFGCQAPKMPLIPQSMENKVFSRDRVHEVVENVTVGVAPELQFDKAVPELKFEKTVLPSSGILNDALKEAGKSLLRTMMKRLREVKDIEVTKAYEPMSTAEMLKLATPIGTPVFFNSIQIGAVSEVNGNEATIDLNDIGKSMQAEGKFVPGRDFIEYRCLDRFEPKSVGLVDEEPKVKVMNLEDADGT